MKKPHRFPTAFPRRQAPTPTLADQVLAGIPPRALNALLTISKQTQMPVGLLVGKTLDAALRVSAGLDWLGFLGLAIRTGSQLPSGQQDPEPEAPPDQELSDETGEQRIARLRAEAYGDKGPGTDPVPQPDEA